jgi:hypothetical protein
MLILLNIIIIICDYLTVFPVAFILLRCLDGPDRDHRCFFVWIKGEDVERMEDTRINNIFFNTFVLVLFSLLRYRWVHAIQKYNIEIFLGLAKSVKRWSGNTVPNCEGMS